MSEKITSDGNPTDEPCNTGTSYELDLKNKELRAKTNTKIVYYYDALCGWCYGFSPVIKEIVEKYGDQIAIEVVSGGLFTGARVGKINEVAPYIKEGAYKFVEERTGVIFGKDFLKIVFGNGDMVLDSLYPSIALSIVKDKKPEKQFEFAEILLKAFYNDGLSATNLKGYLKYTRRVGLDDVDFLESMELPVYHKAASDDFVLFKSANLSGMPSIVLQTKDKQQLISNGYVSSAELILKLNKELQL